MVHWRLLLLLTTLYTLPYGVIFALAPAWGLSLLGLSTNAVGILIARYFAAFALGAGVLTWLVRQRPAGSPPDRATSASMLVAFGITLIVSILAVIQGLLQGVIGWLVIGFDIFFTVGFGYYTLFPQKQ